MNTVRPLVHEKPPARDWSLLPLDVLSLVFNRLSAVDILMDAGLVCHSWLDAAKVPDVWRVVQMDGYEVAVQMYSNMYFRKMAMAKAAIERSDGQLRVFAGRQCVTEELLKYIVQRYLLRHFIFCRHLLCVDKSLDCVHARAN
ncbi:unnamed protein product [Alopecurus aequalis]